MKLLSKFLLLIILFPAVIYAQSNILENIKRNPEEANKMCRDFKDENQKGISVRSNEYVQKLATQRNIDSTEAEILSMYVRGIYCPGVK